MSVALKAPYLLFLGSAPNLLEAKTASGIAYWRREQCSGQLRLPGCGADTGLPDLDLRRALDAGARSLIIGVAPMGGAFEATWIDVFHQAARLGYDIVSGMHTRLSAVPGLAALADEFGGRLVDIRVPPKNIRVATGAKRAGRRLLTVGTDCAVGKKYTALALERELHARGRKATFRATGQTGIMIAGTGIPIDAIVSDFVAGAAEMLSPANDADHWDIVEGQGSLFHPSYAGVTLGLIHGSQPEALVLCHDLSRSMIDGSTVMRSLRFDLYRAQYRGSTTDQQGGATLGVAVNASHLAESAYRRGCDEIEAELNLPCVDPIRDGVARLASQLVA